MVLSAKKIQSSKENNKQEVKLAAIVMGIVGLVSFEDFFLSLPVSKLFHLISDNLSLLIIEAKKHFRNC
jgi:hypothetical protein